MDKWFIRITEENADLLKPHWKTLVSTYVYENQSFFGWLLSEKYDGTYLFYGKNANSAVYKGKEITLEEFQRDILGQISNHTYEIY